MLLTCRWLISPGVAILGAGRATTACLLPRQPGRIAVKRAVETIRASLVAEAAPGTIMDSLNALWTLTSG
jgi:hypothetical protein